MLPREINKKHWHHCWYGCDLLPTMQRSPEWAYIGRSQGPYRVVQQHKILNQASSEGERKATKLFGFGVFFFQFELHVRKITRARYFPLSLMSLSFCAALTEPGQLPLGSHRAAGLVRRSPGLPATFRAKPHGMSDGRQTLIAAFTGFLRYFVKAVSHSSSGTFFCIMCPRGRLLA